jgi:curved DNA-binding protein CbpA
MIDYYAVLGVNPSAEDIVIRAAYKALAQRYHPDRFPGSKEEAHRRMTALTQAYEVLADPVRRPKYDRRRKLHTRAVASRVNHARRFASTALNPRAYASIREIRGRYRAALAALMGAVVVLSAFNVYTHAGRIRQWLGFDAGAPISAGPESASFVQAVAMGPPAPVAGSAGEASSAAPRPAVREKKRSPARNAGSSRAAKTAPIATPAQTCDDVAAVLGLCVRDKPASR